MSITRRDFLKIMAVLTASSGAAGGCAPLAGLLSDPRSPRKSSPKFSAQEWLFLNRISFGPRAGDLQQLRQMGLKNYLEEQLSPELIPDHTANLLLKGFPVLEMEADALRNRGDKLFDNYDPALVLEPFRQATVLRQVYSQRQLYEVMVEFWTDHFNISVQKGDCWFLKVVDDREVIRAHALGDFRSLLGASAHSPAMLVYLDNQENHRHAPNENYARELLELHTLGVNGGYSQADIMELARCLTGWRVKDHFWKGELTFDADTHSPGYKQVLGVQISPGGRDEIDQVLDNLAVHPSTAEYISFKLARRFLGDNPPSRIVNRASQVFLRTGGRIQPVLKSILMDGLIGSNFEDQVTLKYKRPVNYVVSALRLTGADTDGGPAVQRYLEEMGQPLYNWPTPDGYPDTAAAWQGNLLPRWRFALELVQNQIQGTEFDLDPFLDGISSGNPRAFISQSAQVILGNSLDPLAEMDLLQALDPELKQDPRQAAELVLAALIASPAFQWR